MKRLVRLVPILLSLVIPLACARREDSAAVLSTPPAMTPEVVSQPFGTLLKVIHADGAETTGVARGVRVLRGGTEPTAELGMELREGDTVVMDAQTRAVLESIAGSEFLLGTDDEVTLGKGSVFLKRGRLFSKLNEIFRLETKYVVVGVEGTEVDLSVDSADVVSLSVLEGKVRLASKTEKWTAREYGEGEQGVTRGEEPPTKNRLDPTEQQNIRQWVEEFERPKEQQGVGAAR